MIKRLVQGHPAAAVASGSATVALLALAAVFGVNQLAAPAYEEPVQGASEVDAAKPLSKAAWAVTPAEKTLTETLRTPPKGWKADGDVERSVTAPFPYSCPQQGLAPAVALAQTYDANGTRVQIITTAYTAGLGADAMTRQVGNAGTCAGPENAASVSPITEGKAGTEAYLTSTARGATRAAVASSRRGDVITYAITANTTDAIALSKAFDSSLEPRLRDVCRNQDSTSADASRTPWSTVEFTGKLEERKVSIPTVKQPTLPPAETTRIVPIPADPVDLTEAFPLPTPAYPVWPEMPAPMELPTPPEAPAAEARTEATFKAEIKDTDGPGCGWAFTAMPAPVFNDNAAQARALADSSRLVDELEAGAETWQGNVLTYWRDFAAYSEAAKKYQEYSARVSEVNGAWEKIAGQWQAYNDAVAARDEAIAEREDFLSRQEQARKDHEKQVEKCEAEKKAEEEAAKKPAPSPSPSGSPSPSPSPTPTKSKGCPATEPGILSESAPTIPDMPEEPADPRPGQ